MTGTFDIDQALGENECLPGDGPAPIVVRNAGGRARAPASSFSSFFVSSRFSLQQVKPSQPHSLSCLSIDSGRAVCCAEWAVDHVCPREISTINGYQWISRQKKAIRILAPAVAIARQTGLTANRCYREDFRSWRSFLALALAKQRQRVVISGACDAVVHGPYCSLVRCPALKEAFGDDQDCPNLLASTTGSAIQIVVCSSCTPCRPRLKRKFSAAKRTFLE
jgi:hypothetical protein